MSGKTNGMTARRRAIRRASLRADAIRAFFLVGLNADLGVWIEMIRTGRGSVSKAGSKVFCAPGLNCYSCPSALLSCPVGTLQFWIGSQSEKVGARAGSRLTATGLAIIGFLAGIGALGGRICCGFVCPFGTVQEWISRIMSKLFPGRARARDAAAGCGDRERPRGEVRNMRLPAFAKYLKYLVAAVFVLAIPAILVDGISFGPAFCKFLCPSGTLFAGIPLVSFDAGLRASVSWLFALKLAILAGVLVALAFTRRFFCKTLCPFGAFWGLFNRISLWAPRVDKSACCDCGACERACPMHVKVVEDIDSPECVRCLECEAACPEKAIRAGIRREEKSVGNKVPAMPPNN